MATLVAEETRRELGEEGKAKKSEERAPYNACVIGGIEVNMKEMWKKVNINYYMDIGPRLRESHQLA